MDCAEIETVLPYAPDLAQAFVKRNISLSGAACPFPLPVIHELVVNAIVHSDFSELATPIRVAVFDDRIEIENPGNLLPGVTPASMKTGVSRLHNPHIAHVFREMSLMNDWGTGFGQVVEELHSYGLPDPDVQELPGVVRVTVSLLPEPVSELQLVPDDDNPEW